jgi:hypothetical protein
MDAGQASPAGLAPPERLYVRFRRPDSAVVGPPEGLGEVKCYRVIPDPQRAVDRPFLLPV